MTTITIERSLLEQIIEKFAACGCEVCTLQSINAIRAALAAPATAPEQMPLERDCICHQDLHIDGYSGGAAPEGLYGALWVVVEGVGKKYVLADQSSEPKDMPAPATAPAQPAWHDAPTVPGLWVCLRDSRHKSYRVRDIEVQVTIPEDGDRWYGPMPEDKP